MVGFGDEQEAARSLLGESVLILQEAKLDFSVVGGWIPFLFNQGQYTHPGTFDVDVLLKAGTTVIEVETAGLIFREKGYFRPAKNLFQLIRIITTAGESRAYHVDFLHPRYAPDQDGILLLYGGLYRSIAGPGLDIVFTDDERMTQSLRIRLPNGTEHKVEVPFVTEVAFLSAKARSVGSVKRPRDPFDVFLVISQSQNPGRLLNRSKELYASNGVFRTSLNRLRLNFAEAAVIRQAAEHMHRYGPASSASIDELDKIASTKVNMFLDEVGVASCDELRGINCASLSMSEGGRQERGFASLF